MVSSAVERCRTGVPPARRLFQGVGQEGEEARALDRLGQLALLLGRDRGDAARHDLAALGDEALQQLDVLVVDLGRAWAGERAGFAAPEERTARAASSTARAAGIAVPPGVTAGIAPGITMVAHAPTPSAAVPSTAAGASRGSSRSRPPPPPPSSRRSPP